MQQKIDTYYYIELEYQNLLYNGQKQGWWTLLTNSVLLVNSNYPSDPATWKRAQNNILASGKRA